LAPGKYANLAVFSDDYFSIPEDRIKEIESVLTVTGGRVVYGAGPFTGFATGVVAGGEAVAQAAEACLTLMPRTI
jgi:Amidohydrolase family